VDSIEKKDYSKSEEIFSKITATSRCKTDYMLSYILTEIKTISCDVYKNYRRQEGRSM